MSDYGVLANFEALEGTVSGEMTLTFNLRSRKLVITNDHATNDLQFKFNASREYATLKGTESLSLYFWARKIIINGDNVPYRVWVFG